MIKPFGDLLIRFRKDERGIFLVFFALIAVVLIAASGAVVDFTRVQQARTRAQIALDAAALALQAKISTKTAAQLKEDAQDLLTERIADTSVTAVVESATPDIPNGKLTISGYISVPTYFVQLVGIKDIRSTMLSEVTRASKDLEVSLSIDITGSMRPTGCDWQGKNCTTDKIGDLIDASNMLIGLLVSDTQTPTYSKMAIVPWSYSVNVGSLANSVRGTPIAGVTISSATWMSGTAKTITAITRASPAQVTTSTNHGFAVDDYVYISGVSGMTNLNNNIYRVKAVPTTKTLTLKTTGGSNVNSSTWSAFTTGGTPRITKCLNSSCQVLVTTASAHGLTAGNTVYISGAGGMTGLNTTHVGAVGTVPSTTSYYLTDFDSDAALYNTYTANSAKSYCVVYGCSYFRFTDDQSWSPGTHLWQPNNCATDRTVNTYTDAAPSTTPLGMHYTSGGADCIPNHIVPLTSDKATLKGAIGSTDANNDGVKDDYRTRTLQAVGSTAGHLGLAWGWYMVAPNFGYLWPSATPAPKAYGSTNLIKAVIFMTDGVFNTPYCNGVTASDATSGAPGDDEQINCSSPNGSSKSQAESLCTAIKAVSNHIDLYVVGFDLATDTASLTFLQNCATDADHFYRADTGEDLEAAFADIAQNLSDLRISK
jgi:Flp pilus assembly protein TadG